MKKKIFVVALVVCILAISIASATIAYFTDTESAKNTFTSGNVDIKLFETNNVGTEVEITAGANQLEFANKYPGESFAKKPTIQNVANDAAYVAGIITLGSGAEADITGLLADDDAVKAFLTGGALNAASGYATKIVRDATANTITIYIIATDAVAKDGKVVLFENVKIPAKWDSAEMAKFAKLTITVKAYAVQKTGFDSAENAIKAAFGGGTDATNSDFANYFN
jgi:predicted ribosomally synthesized peptide with SipW-like signal peptide